MSKPQKNTNLKTLKYFWKFTKPDKFYFFAGTFGAMVGVILGDVLPPFIIAKSFDRLQQAFETGNAIEFSDISGYIVAYIIVAISALVVWRFQVLAVWKYEIRSMQRIAEYLFNHLQKQGQKFHSNRFGGALVSQANKFLSSYERVMDEFTWSVTTGIVAFLASFAVLITVSPIYALILLITSVSYLAVMYWRVKLQLPFDRRLATSESQRTAKIADMITNVNTVRSYAGEKFEVKRFKKQADETTRHYNALLRQVFINDLYAHGGTATIAILAYSGGLFAVTNFNAPVGVLYLAITYTLSINQRLWEGRRVMRNLSRSFGDATDMTEIMQIEPEIKDIENPEKLNIKKGKIEFNDVEFGYSDSIGEPVFQNLNLSIEGGDKIGLVGHSGGGKSTITSLLLRFLDIQKGTIKIDGFDISKIRQEDLRNNIAYVPQEPLLFHRSIAENISYGNPSASKSQIEEAAKKAHAHEFIVDLPKGYNTLVGERGVKLSGGQRQRVAIARAILKDAPILILDEATSSLDSESEKLIQDALKDLMENKTSIIIAHRLSTIQQMDRIVVLEKGKISETGTHQELVKNKGIYSTLWAHQSGGFIEE